MVKLTNLNNISAALEAEIPEFGPGDVRTYQVINAVSIEDAETGAKEIAYGKFSIRAKDKIYDPYKKDTVNIGIPVSYEGDKIFEYYLFFPCKDIAKFLGKFDLQGDNPEDVDMFRFLWLSNLLENNPHRNKREQPMFRLLDFTDVPVVKKELVDDKEVVTVIKPSPVRRQPSTV